MKQNPPSARFWEYLPIGPVKITLKPGQTLFWCDFGQTDEGWYAYYVTWEHEGDKVVCSTMNDGRDCDGRVTHYHTSQCPLDELAAGAVDFEGRPGVAYPHWQEVSFFQRDEHAEMMGY